MKEFSYNDLSAILGVSRPLLMLDRLSVSEDCRQAAGVKQISLDEAHFAGHFPGQPVMPGVLQTAAMCQAAQMMYIIERGELMEGFRQSAVLALRRVKFRTPVRPGMTMRLECVQSAVLEDGSVEYQVKNLADGQIASSGTVVIGSIPDSYYDFVEDEGESPVLPSLDAPFMDTVQLMEVLPHRYPFMFVDRAYGLDDITCVTGVKNVTGNGMFVSAFSVPRFEGYLQIEAGAQLGCAALLSQPSERGKLGFFMSIDSAVFHAPVLPGDQLAMRVTCESRGRFGLAQGKMYVGSRLVTDVEIKFAIVSAEEAAGGR